MEGQTIVKERYRASCDHMEGPSNLGIHVLIIHGDCTERNSQV